METELEWGWGTELGVGVEMGMDWDRPDQSPFEGIILKGAREHNLKNISLRIPRRSLTVITGLSGSGKSTLAFDTIYAEGQRRYLESLSTYARNFLDQLKKPELDSISGLSPALAIDQKTGGHSPRSTVGTVTEVYDFLRLLFAKLGTPICPQHRVPLTSQTSEQILDGILRLPQESLRGQPLLILAPVVQGKKGEFGAEMKRWVRLGFSRAKIDGQWVDLEGGEKLTKTKHHDIELLIDRVLPGNSNLDRVRKSIETALSLGHGRLFIEYTSDEVRISNVYSLKEVCPVCYKSFPPLEPRLFSFNTPKGACTRCQGLGVISSTSDGEEGRERVEIGEIHEGEDEAGEDQESGLLTCPSCQGHRLNPEALTVLVEGRNIGEISDFSAERLLEWVKDLGKKKVSHSDPYLSGPDLVSLPLSPQNSSSLLPINESNVTHQVKEKITEQIKERLSFLIQLGLGYLSLGRSLRTLSGGEVQRLRLASQLGSSLIGVLYVMDEPSIGLHPRDHHRLLQFLRTLRDRGNTLIVVEHDEETIRSADYVIDLGPRAGREGGHLVAQGTPQELMENPESLTGQYLLGRKEISPLLPAVAVSSQHQGISSPLQWLVLRGASGHNLKNVDFKIPLGALTVVTGVSGSGKSTLVIDTLYRILAQRFWNSPRKPEPYQGLEGVEHLDRVVEINQRPIGRTPRSTPATYVGILPLLRGLFAEMRESQARGYGPGRFSFNVKGGRCETCLGQGQVRMEMHFMPDVFVPCEVCQGRRYNRETLDIQFKGKNIYEVLSMSVEEAREFFRNQPLIFKKLETLHRVGLDYMTLGQSSTTLSGGEAQRIKLSRELSKRGKGHTLYILDEPTTGLHFEDIRRLLELLRELTLQGHTVLLIEHHLDIIRTADYVIDLGPEGGERGGQILASGKPEDIARHPTSHTGKFLAEKMRFMKRESR